MEHGSLGQVQAVPLGFHRTCKLLHRLLGEGGISVVEHIELSHAFPSENAVGIRRCVLWMVDCPMLLFEAVALDRAAAVFLPLHIVITGDEHSTCIHWTHPAEAMGLRLPPAAKRPVDTLYCRLSQVLRGGHQGQEAFVDGWYAGNR